MSISGIQIPEEVIKKYEDKRFEKKPGGLILKIDDETIKIDKEASEDMAQFVDGLPNNEPRYCLIDVPVRNRANLDDVRTIFIFWMTMESAVKLRMRYASTKASITKAFRGIAAQIQPDEKSEITLEKIQAKINRGQGINNP